MCNQEVRFTLKIGHRQPGPSGPKSAKTGLVHCDKRSLFDYCVGTAEQRPR